MKSMKTYQEENLGSSSALLFHTTFDVIKHCSSYLSNEDLVNFSLISRTYCYAAVVTLFSRESVEAIRCQEKWFSVTRNTLNQLLFFIRAGGYVSEFTSLFKRSLLNPQSAITHKLRCLSILNSLESDEIQRLNQIKQVKAIEKLQHKIKFSCTLNKTFWDILNSFLYHTQIDLNSELFDAIIEHLTRTHYKISKEIVTTLEIITGRLTLPPNKIAQLITNILLSKHAQENVPHLIRQLIIKIEKPHRILLSESLSGYFSGKGKLTSNMLFSLRELQLLLPKKIITVAIMKDLDIHSTHAWRLADFFKSTHNIQKKQIRQLVETMTKGNGASLDLSAKILRALVPSLNNKRRALLLSKLKHIFYDPDFHNHNTLKPVLLDLISSFPASVQLTEFQYFLANSTQTNLISSDAIQSLIIEWRFEGITHFADYIRLFMNALLSDSSTYVILLPLIELISDKLPVNENEKLMLFLLENCHLFFRTSSAQIFDETLLSLCQSLSDITDNAFQRIWAACRDSYPFQSSVAETILANVFQLLSNERREQTLKYFIKKNEIDENMLYPELLKRCVSKMSHVSDTLFTDLFIDPLYSDDEIESIFYDLMLVFTQDQAEQYITCLLNTMEDDYFDFSQMRCVLRALPLISKISGDLLAKIDHSSLASVSAISIELIIESVEAFINTHSKIPDLFVKLLTYENFLKFSFEGYSKYSSLVSQCAHSLSHWQFSQVISGLLQLNPAYIVYKISSIYTIYTSSCHALIIYDDVYELILSTLINPNAKVSRIACDLIIDLFDLLSEDQIRLLKSKLPVYYNHFNKHVRLHACRLMQALVNLKSESECDSKMVYIDLLNQKLLDDNDAVSLTALESLTTLSSYTPLPGKQLVIQLGVLIHTKPLTSMHIKCISELINTLFLQFDQKERLDLIEQLVCILSFDRNSNAAKYTVASVLINLATTLRDVEVQVITDHFAISDSEISLALDCLIHYIRSPITRKPDLDAPETQSHVNYSIA